jgi:hypothetical protein
MKNCLVVAISRACSMNTERAAGESFDDYVTRMLGSLAVNQANLAAVQADLAANLAAGLDRLVVGQREILDRLEKVDSAGRLLERQIRAHVRFTGSDGGFWSGGIVEIKGKYYIVGCRHAVIGVAAVKIEVFEKVDHIQMRLSPVNATGYFDFSGTVVPRDGYPDIALTPSKGTDEAAGFCQPRAATIGLDRNALGQVSCVALIEHADNTCELVQCAGKIFYGGQEPRADYLSKEGSSGWLVWCPARHQVIGVHRGSDTELQSGYSGRRVSGWKDSGFAVFTPLMREEAERLVPGSTDVVLASELAETSKCCVMF